MAMGGGPVESIVFAGRRFSVDAEADVKLILGGFTNNIKPNGDQTSRIVKAMKLAEIKDGVFAIDNDRGDHEFIQSIADEFDMQNAEVTLVDGNVYSGLMQIEGEFEYSAKEGTMTVSLKGSLGIQ